MLTYMNLFQSHWLHETSKNTIKGEQISIKRRMVILLMIELSFKSIIYFELKFVYFYYFCYIVIIGNVVYGYDAYKYRIFINYFDHANNTNIHYIL